MQCRSDWTVGSAWDYNKNYYDYGFYHPVIRAGEVKNNFFKYHF